MPKAFTYEEVKQFIEVESNSGCKFKSFLIALISLMAMMDEQENETYSFAGKKEQARICFEQAKALIRSNPKISRKFKLKKLEIVLKKNNSKFQPRVSVKSNTLELTEDKENSQ